jgi:amino acid permease
MRKQSVPQRRALQKLAPPDTVIRRTLYQKARQDIFPKYGTIRIAILMLLLCAWLALSHFTQFKTHLTQWLVTGVFPATDFWSVAIYVVGFTLSAAAFIWANKILDDRIESRIDAHFVHLVHEYEDQHGVTLTVTAPQPAS